MSQSGKYLMLEPVAISFIMETIACILVATAIGIFLVKRTK